MKVKKLLRFAFYSLGAAVILAQSCFAYIDPATTSLIIQIIAGVIIACGTAVGIFWSRIKRKFKKKNGDEDSSEITNTKQEGDSDEKVVITADDLLADDDEQENEDEQEKEQEK